MAKFVFSAFADEAGASLDEQISALKGNGIHYIEPRNIDNKCIVDFTDEELRAAKMTLISQIQAAQDSAGGIESYYMNGIFCGVELEPEEHIRLLEEITPQQVMAAAASYKQNTVYFLKGVQ